MKPRNYTKVVINTSYFVHVDAVSFRLYTVWVLLAVSVFNCINFLSEFYNILGYQQGRGGLFVQTWKAHHTKRRWPPRERLPLSATIRFNSTLQCGRCFGYLHPHNPRGLNVAVPAFVLVFSLVFSPRDLY